MWYLFFALCMLFGGVAGQYQLRTTYNCSFLYQANEGFTGGHFIYDYDDKILLINWTIPQTQYFEYFDYTNQINYKFNNTSKKYDLSYTDEMPKLFRITSDIYQQYKFTRNKNGITYTFATDQDYIIQNITWRDKDINFQFKTLGCTINSDPYDPIKAKQLINFIKNEQLISQYSPVCHQTSNLIFIVDESFAVTEYEMNRTNKFIIDTIQRYNLHDHRTLVSIIYYNNEARYIINMTNDIEIIKTLLYNIKYHKGMSCLTCGFNAAKELIETYESVRNVDINDIIIISSSKPNYPTDSSEQYYIEYYFNCKEPCNVSDKTLCIDECCSYRSDRCCCDRSDRVLVTSGEYDKTNEINISTFLTSPESYKYNIITIAIYDEYDRNVLNMLTRGNDNNMHFINSYNKLNKNLVTKIVSNNCKYNVSSCNKLCFGLCGLNGNCIHQYINKIDNFCTRYIPYTIGNVGGIYTVQEVQCITANRKQYYVKDPNDPNCCRYIDYDPEIHCLPVAYNNKCSYNLISEKTGCYASNEISEYKCSIGQDKNCLDYTCDPYVGDCIYTNKCPGNNKKCIGIRDDALCTGQKCETTYEESYECIRDQCINDDECEDSINYPNACLEYKCINNRCQIVYDYPQEPCKVTHCYDNDGKRKYFYTDVDCMSNNTDKCVTGTCNINTGQCEYKPKCNDNKYCTHDFCDSKTGSCFYEDVVCPAVVGSNVKCKEDIDNYRCSYTDICHKLFCKNTTIEFLKYNSNDFVCKYSDYVCPNEDPCYIYTCNAETDRCEQHPIPVHMLNQCSYCLLKYKQDGVHGYSDIDPWICTHSSASESSSQYNSSLSPIPHSSIPQSSTPYSSDYPSSHSSIEPYVSSSSISSPSTLFSIISSISSFFSSMGSSDNSKVDSSIDSSTDHSEHSNSQISFANRPVIFNPMFYVILFVFNMFINVNANNI